MTMLEIEASEFFEHRSETVVFPALRNFEESLALCKKFHGSHVVIKNKAQSDRLNEQWWDLVGIPMGVSPWGKLGGLDLNSWLDLQFIAKLDFHI